MHTLEKNNCFFENATLGMRRSLGAWLRRLRPGGQDTGPADTGTAPPPVRPLDRIVAAYGRGSGQSVLFLGDSTVERIARQDTDRRTTDAMLAAYYGGDVLGATHSAYHPTVYRHLARLFEVLPGRPRLVVIPVNLRSFSPIWEYRPEFQFTEEFARMEAYARHGRLLPPEEPLRDEAAWRAFLDVPLGVAGCGLERVGDYLRLAGIHPEDAAGRIERRRQLFMVHFLSALTPENRRLVDLGETALFLTRLRVNVLIYLSPINMVSGLRHVGEAFPARVAANVRLVLDACDALPLTGGRLCAVDFSADLDETFFFQPDETTEHLNQTGRGALAGRLAGLIETHDLLGKQPVP
jgi:hypothetical protein